MTDNKKFAPASKPLATSSQAQASAFHTDDPQEFEAAVTFANKSK